MGELFLPKDHYLYPVNHPAKELFSIVFLSSLIAWSAGTMLGWFFGSVASSFSANGMQVESLTVPLVIISMLFIKQITSFIFLVLLIALPLLPVPVCRSAAAVGTFKKRSFKLQKFLLSRSVYFKQYILPYIIKPIWCGMLSTVALSIFITALVIIICNLPQISYFSVKTNAFALVISAFVMLILIGTALVLSKGKETEKWAKH